MWAALSSVGAHRSSRCGGTRRASSSADPSKAAKDTKLKVGATDEGQFMEGYEDFLAKNQARSLSLEHSAAWRRLG